MGRGPKKHLKRIAAPPQWGLDKLGGYWAPRPRGGPHKLRECIPLVLILRNKLRFAFTKREAKIICNERNVFIDGKVKKDFKFPAGFMDVLSLPKIGRHYRMMFDTTGKFNILKISEKESKFKLCKVTKIIKMRQGFPAVTTSDGRVIRFAPPGIKLSDSIKISLPDQKMLKVLPFRVGSLCMADSGRNTGRMGEIVKIEKHQATFDIVYLRDVAGKIWTTRKDSIFVIGEDKKAFVSVPGDMGVKLDPVDFRKKMMRDYVEKRRKKSKEGFSMANVRDKIMKIRKKKDKKKDKKKKEVKKDDKEFFEILKFRNPKVKKPKPTTEK